VLKHFSIDFVVGLLPAQTIRHEVVDAILVIVDRLSKYVVYILVRGTIDAPIIADIVEEAIFTKFGMPLSLVSDRGSLFTSAF